jgi:hypothetical protein
MRTTAFVSLFAVFLLAIPSSGRNQTGFEDSLVSHDNFIIAHGWGPERWGM